MMTLKKPAPCSGRVYQVLIKKNDGHLRAAADASVRKGAHVAPSCAHLPRSKIEAVVLASPPK